MRQTDFAKETLGWRRPGLSLLDLNRDASKHGCGSDIPALTERECAVRVERVGMVSLVDEPLCRPRRGGCSLCGHARGRTLVRDRIGGTGKRLCLRDNRCDALPSVLAGFLRGSALRAQRNLAGS